MTVTAKNLQPTQQVRLASGAEIICTVEVSNLSSFFKGEENFLTATDVLAVFVAEEDYEDETITRWAFRPLMGLQTQIERPMLLLRDTIEILYVPEEEMVDRYKEIISTAREKRAEMDKEEAREELKSKLKVIPFNREPT